MRQIDRQPGLIDGVAAGYEDLDPRADTSPASHRLADGLKQRHVVMLSIGGSVGVGLFVGSGHAIAEAGPAAVLAYVFGSLLVVTVMRMFGEMACVMPDSGSLSAYTDKAIGSWADFTIGWMYWGFWVLVVPLEATAAANVLNGWVPDVPVWQLSVLVTAGFTVANLASVKNYGELEFWFAIIKVSGILLFIGCGIAAISGLLPSVHLAPIVGALLATMFAFLGAEVVKIAAAESENPAREVGRAITLVGWRISLFYIGSVLFIICAVLWNDPDLSRLGAYQVVLRSFHIPYAQLITDGLILVVVGSCLNSALCTASRMMYSLGRRNLALRFVTRTTANGVPACAVMASSLVAFLACGANYLAPKYVFDALLSTTGAIALLVYLVIAVSKSFVATGPLEL